MKLYCVIDEKSKDYPTVLHSLNKLKEQYAGIENVEWKLAYQDLSGLNWVKYGYSEGDLGVDTTWIQEDTKKIFKNQQWDIDCVLYFIDQSNWKQGTTQIFGWNLGKFYNNYQVELIRCEPPRIPNLVPEIDQGYRNVMLTVFMEVHHALNDFVWAETGMSLAKFLDVADWDEDVTHGRTNPPYKKFEYRNSIELIGPFLNETFKKRREHQWTYLLQEIIRIFRILGIQITGIPSPVERSELEGWDDHVNHNHTHEH